MPPRRGQPAQPTGISGQIPPAAVPSAAASTKRTPLAPSANNQGELARWKEYWRARQRPGQALKEGFGAAATFLGSVGGAARAEAISDIVGALIGEIATGGIGEIVDEAIEQIEDNLGDSAGEEDDGVGEWVLLRVKSIWRIVFIPFLYFFYAALFSVFLHFMYFYGDTESDISKEHLRITFLISSAFFSFLFTAQHLILVVKEKNIERPIQYVLYAGFCVLAYVVFLKQVNTLAWGAIRVQVSAILYGSFIACLILVVAFVYGLLVGLRDEKK